MTYSIQRARDAAHSIRYRHDKPVAFAEQNDAALDQIKHHYSRSGLLINANTTPDLESSLTGVCKNLLMPRKSVTAFISASPEIQASCHSLSSTQCVVQFSSALVNLLDGLEFAFVAGHELGHFLLEHGARDLSQKSAEAYMLMRAQEISVDRIGLAGCNDVNAAMRALMKTISGLESRHLKFDVGQFISQISQISSSKYYENFSATHPSMVIRGRALLWFSMDEGFAKFPAELRSAKTDAIDEKVQKEINKHIDGPLKEKIGEIKNEIGIWMAIMQILSDGKFDKPAQEKFSEVFGKEMLTKMQEFIIAGNRREVMSHIKAKFAESRDKLEAALPMSFKDEYAKIKSAIQAKFE